MQGFLCKISLSLRCLCMSAGSIFAAGESFQGKHHIGVCSGLFMDAFLCESWKVAIRPDFYCPRRGKCLSAPIGIVPAGESGYPVGFVLSPPGIVLLPPPGIVLLRQDSGCRLNQQCFSLPICVVDSIDRAYPAGFVPSTESAAVIGANWKKI